MTALAPISNGEATPDAIPARTDDGLSAFVAARPRLFGIAYRMLGSAFDAEDVVQDAWLRWQTTDRSIVRSASAFLAATTTRLAINLVQSAHSRRETPSETWLEETADASADPGSEAERGEALERAVLLLLEQLSPTERAAYVLSEAFDYPYARIADVLQVSQANARQIASRARKHLAALKEPLDADLASDSRPFSLRSSSAPRRDRRAARGAHPRGMSGDPGITVRHRTRCHELPSGPVSLVNGRDATPKGAQA